MVILIMLWYNMCCLDLYCALIYGLKYSAYITHTYFIQYIYNIVQIQNNDKSIF